MYKMRRKATNREKIFAIWSYKLIRKRKPDCFLRQANETSNLQEIK